ncbi:hypothetical protein E0E62_29000 [Streptomyces sp. 16-176A]
MRHTVRRSSRGVEQVGSTRRPTSQAAARTALSGAAPGTTPGRPVRGATRTRPKVPERTGDSGT